MSISSTTRRGASMASAFASSSRLIRLRPSRFSSWLSTSVSNPMQARGQGCPALPDLLGADQPEYRILRQSLRIVHIFVSCQATIDGLSQQVHERQLHVLSPPSVQDVFDDERTQSQTFIQLAHQKQTTVGGDTRTLKINF